MPSRRQYDASGRRLPIDDPHAWISPYPCQSCRTEFSSRYQLATHHCDPYGRGTKPESKSRRLRLTDDQVRDIRNRYAEGKANMEQLGEEYGCAATTISRVIHRKTFAHVE